MTDSYCSRDDVAAAVSQAGQELGAVNEDRLDLACLLGTGYVDTYVTGTVLDTDLASPYTVEVVACPPAFRAAAILAAVRFLAAKDVPFGVVNVGEYGKVIGSIPEADLLLRGHRAEVGLA